MPTPRRAPRSTPRARAARAVAAHAIARAAGALSAIALLGAMAGCDRARVAATGDTGKAAQAETAPGEVSIDVAGPGGAVLLVPVYINGKGPYDFVLDTGATMTCLDQSLADSLRLPARFGQVGVGLGVGGAGQVPIVRIDSLRTGDTSASQVSACLLDLSHLKALGPKVEGLLGLNFLKSYRVTLDFERNVARLEKP
jgi:predicted aspartyl protease